MGTGGQWDRVARSWLVPHPRVSLVPTSGHPLLRSRLLPALFAVALALAACSSGDDAAAPDTGPTTPGSTEGAAAAPTELVSDDLPDGVAARVGEVDISADDLEARFSLAVEIPEISQQLEQGDPATVEGRLRAQLLSEMVLQEVVLQGAAAEGIEVTDDQVASQRDSLVEQAGGEEAFAEQLRQAAVPEEQLNEQLRAGLAIEQATEQRLGGETTEPEAATPPAQGQTPDPATQARQEFLLGAIDALQVVVDRDFGAWDPNAVQVVPA